MKIIKAINQFETYKTEYLDFIKGIQDKKKTYDIEILNKSKQNIGNIFWHGAWRKYVVEFEPNIILDTKCLGTVVDYIHQLMEERKRS